MREQITHTSSNMRKQIDLNNQTNEFKPSIAIDQQAYQQKVQNNINLYGTNTSFKVKNGMDLIQSDRYLKDGIDMPKRQQKIHKGSLWRSIFQKSQQKNIQRQKRSQKSQHSVQSYKSTTYEQIMSKYDISQIVKRTQEEQQNKCRTCSTFCKIFFMIIFFPITLIWLLVRCIQQRVKAKEDKQKKQKQKIDIKNRKKPKIIKRVKKQSQCCSSCQNCCQNCFCYYVCCECCQDCNCCTKCCRKIERCLENICQNKLMDCIENCFYCCFVKSCQKCCRCLCCHNRTHEKLDTIERMQSMGRRNQND